MHVTGKDKHGHKVEGWRKICQQQTGVTILIESRNQNKKLVMYLCKHTHTKQHHIQFHETNTTGHKSTVYLNTVKCMISIPTITNRYVIQAKS
jgi:hypothetical protein